MIFCDTEENLELLELFWHFYGQSFLFQPVRFIKLLAWTVQWTVSTSTINVEVCTFLAIDVDHQRSSTWINTQKTAPFITTLNYAKSELMPKANKSLIFFIFGHFSNTCTLR